MYMEDKKILVKKKKLNLDRNNNDILQGYRNESWNRNMCNVNKKKLEK